MFVAILEGVVKFFGTPLGRWILIAGLVSAALAAAGLHERSVGYAEAMDHVHAQQKAEEDAYLRILAARQKALADLTAKNVVITAKAEKDLQDEKTKSALALADLKKRTPNYVSEASTRATCPVLPTGYLLQRRNDADFANDKPASAPEPSAELAAAASGVSLTTLSDTDHEQAGAFLACAQRVKAWEQYADQVDAWSADVDRILNAVRTGDSP